MRTCPQCALESPEERDFCECGEYLRWEPTGATRVIETPVAPAPLPTPVMSPATSPADVVLGLVSPTGAWLSSPTLDVEAGGEARFGVHVRNQRGIVDHFDVRLDGIPESWWSVAPQTLHLVPYGSSGPCEGDVTVTLHPPRTPEAHAREWPIRVIASSRSERADVARVPAAVRIGRYDAVETTIAPARRSARRRAHYRVGIRNGGNAAAQVTLDARDDSDRCRLAIPGAQLEVGPGAAAERQLTVSPRRPLLLGRPIERRLEVLASAGGEDLPHQGAQFVQKAWLPRWLPLALAPLAVLLAATLTFSARVPDVRGVPIEKAKREPDAHHLGSKPPRVPAKPRRATKVPLPSVAGRPAAQAEAALAATGLEPHVKPEIDTRPAGVALGTRPAHGKLNAGDPVELRVSAGFPQVAYDDGHALYVADGRDGSARRRLRLAGGGGRQTQPNWTPDGQRLVYRSGVEGAGRIWLSGAGLRGGRPLTSGGDDARRPAVSPDGALVAFVRGARPSAAHRLCFVRVAPPRASGPGCRDRSGHLTG